MLGRCWLDYIYGKDYDFTTIYAAGDRSWVRLVIVRACDDCPAGGLGQLPDLVSFQTWSASRPRHRGTDGLRSDDLGIENTDTCALTALRGTSRGAESGAVRGSI